ncbi:interleukin-12 subunit beta-like [Megalops cyprinoides]|uniref:interleukin-12 subunit beta-like n=1 Tax=Megalops cyprinoides TaxID=118141 RepID=UPI00186486B4|nr:interleukin-12 subunit beta-like [Megalops cyprinoides]
MNLVLLSVLLIALQQAQGSSSQPWLLKPNVLVVEKEMQSTVEVPLICGESFEGAEISWRNEGEELGQRGNRITVTVEEMMAGNYTCHDSAGALLGHQLVLVQVQGGQRQRKILKGSDNADYIKCSSKNYGGIFRCSWQWSNERKGSVVLISATRSSDGRDITCTLDSDEAGITCTDQFQCAYSEEQDHIELEVYVRSLYRLEKYFSSFSISEIVKPDSVHIAKLQGSTFELQYPETWSVPASFFPLRFHIKVVPHKKDCDYEAQSRTQVIFTQNQTFSVNNRREFLLCVRAQDPLCNSAWSEWSKYE